MITMNELVDLRMQQHIAHEIYRQQIMQRIPDPFPPLLPIPMPRHVIMPPRITLPGVEVTLQNDDLWKQFHQIGTEMIITKSGRRMFPSMRLSLAGLDEESNYCVLLEMVPIGDCRYKFSGSQWVPAGGAEPQSPQRMYLHPDSPASGSHWQAQPILFNKVKLTNNTLDSSGHIVLASMHKYQPRIHVIRTSDLTQIPWAPQQAFVFPETEFVAVTAYQNDRITKLKIDNNPFAKGFRETGQSRCKRKMSSSPSDDDQEQPNAQQQKQQPRSTHQSQSHSHQHRPPNDMSPTKSALTTTSDSGSSICSDKPALHSGGDDIVDDVDVDSIVDGPQIKRMRSNGSACSITSALDEAHATGHADAEALAGAGGGLLLSSGETSLPNATHEWQATLLAAGQPPPPCGSFASGSAGASFMQHFQHNMQTLLRPSLVDLACTYFGRPQPIYAQHVYAQQQQQHAALAAATQPLGDSAIGTLQLQEPLPLPLPLPLTELPNSGSDVNTNNAASAGKVLTALEPNAVQRQQEDLDPLQQSPPTKKKGFSISAILGGGS